MRVGISTSAFACERIEDPERDMERFLAFCREMRLERVQIELASVNGFGTDAPVFRRTLKQVRNRLKHERIVVWIGSALDVSDWGRASEQDADELRQSAFDLVETANAAGMSVLDVTGLPVPDSPEWSTFVKKYGALVEHAGRCGLRLAACCTGAAFARLAEEVPDPEVNGFCLCFATCHKAGEVVAEVAAASGDRVFHAHASDVVGSDGKWRPAMLGRGELDVPRAVEALAHLAYLPITVTHCPAIAGLPNSQASVAWGVAYLRGLAETD